MAAAKAAELSVDRAGRWAAFGGRSVRLGVLEAALLRYVLAGPLTAARAKRQLWPGREAVPDVSLRELAYRANRKLESIGCPLAVGLDRGRVTIR